MSIGTAKPSKEEMQNIPHHLIDSHSVIEEVSAARFAREADEIIQHLFRSHEKLILVGGSGMFIDALIYGIDEIPTSEPLKKELIEEFEKNGLDNFLSELKEKDPLFFYKVDKTNPARVLRAIEAIRLTSRPFSELRSGTKKKLNYVVKRIIIEHNREFLYQRINERVDQMVQAGLMDEVKKLIPYRNLTALNTVGYSEMFEYLDGKIELTKAIELIKQHTRNYAKRQITWSKRYEDAFHLPFSDMTTMMQESIKFIES